MTPATSNNSVTVRRFDAFSYLRYNATVRADALAVYDRDAQLDFARLLGTVRSAMVELRARGIRFGDVVAVCLPNVWRYIALEIAIPALGAVLLPMPSRLGPREAAATLQRSGAVLLVVDETTSGVADGTETSKRPPIVFAGDVVASTSQRSADPERPDSATDDGRLCDPGRIVQIAMTSGTTGLPKLASLSARLKQLTFDGFTRRLAFGPDDRMLPMSPITQGVGEMCLYALRTGAALVMTNDPRFDPVAVLQLAAESRTTVIGGVPTMLGRMLPEIEHAPVGLASLRATISAGSALSPDLARRWEELTGSATCSFYGAMDIGQLAVPSPDDPAEKRWTTVGKPHDAAEWQICGSDGRPLPAGVEGEICMRGALVQDRYWNDESPVYASDGWAHFGDLGLVDESGYLHVTGRLKDTIIRGGNNINPIEVESLLREHPHVLDVALVGRPHEDLGEEAVAFVVPQAGRTLELSDVSGYLDQRGLTRYKSPEQLHLVDVLPTTPTGKVDRSYLRKLLTALPTDGPAIDDPETGAI